MTVEFTIDDVVSRVEKWRSDNRKGIENSLCLGHDLFGPVFFRGDLSQLVHPRYRSTRRGALYLENPLQRAVAQTAFFHGCEYVDTMETILQLSARNLKRNKKKKIAQSAQSLIETLTRLDGYTPLLDLITSVDEVNEDQRYWINRADFAIGWLLYINNRYFSDDFSPEEFVLDLDFKNFVMRTNEFLSRQNLIIVNGDIREMHTKVDYLRNVIEPLIWNAAQHATTPGEKTYLQVIGTVEKDKNHDVVEGSPYTVIVRDGGRGIPEDVLPRIFDKGFTTKSDTATDHGIGLYEVKKFIEEQGGSISVSSTLGKGTRFEFTIPYSRVEAKWVCIQ